MKNLLINSIAEAKKIISDLNHSLEQKGSQPDSEILTIIKALLQVFDIAQATEQQNQILDENEIIEIGEQGLSLLDNLIYQLRTQNLESQVPEIGQVALVIAQWVIVNNGQLENIQPIVDALANKANALQDKAVLSQLSGFMTQVASACTNVIKHDLDNSNPSRPWRILNLNRGIVATRSLNVDVMNSVFPDLIKAIPLDAPGFFKEGMTEMIRLNYPEAICDLMKKFHDQTKLPAVH